MSQHHTLFKDWCIIHWRSKAVNEMQYLLIHLLICVYVMAQEVQYARPHWMRTGPFLNLLEKDNGCNSSKNC